MTEAEFDAVMRLFRRSGERRGRRAPEFLGHRILFCSCGQRLVPRTKKNRNGSDYQVYRSYGRFKLKNGCTMPPLPRAILDAALFEMIEQRILKATSRDEAAADGVRRMRAAKEAAIKQAGADVRKLDAAKLRADEQFAYPLPTRLPSASASTRRP